MSPVTDHASIYGMGEAALLAERDGLRAALAAARGTVLDLRSHLADMHAAQEFLRLSRAAAVTESQAAREQAAAATAALGAVSAERDALLSERDRLRGVRDAHEARLRELEPAAVQARALVVERDALARRVASLDRLVRHLRWEDGPRAVRAVLPLARLARCAWRLSVRHRQVVGARAR